MRLLAFAVFDVKAECYMRPFFAETVGLALRSFRDIVNDGSSPFAKHPEDYTLFKIGAFDTSLGSFVSEVVSLGPALSFIKAVE